MSFGQAVKSVFKRYAQFSGRASRSEFWWFYLFMVIVNMVIGIPYYIGIFTSPRETVATDGGSSFVLTSINGVGWFGLGLLTIWFLATVIPTLAVSARRLHDTNKTAWWLLLYFLACCAIGPIILLIFFLMPSTPGPNRYGEGPEGPAA